MAALTNQIAAEDVVAALDIEMANGFNGEVDKLAEAGLEHTAADGDIYPTATEKAALGIGGKGRGAGRVRHGHSLGRVPYAHELRAVNNRTGHTF